MQTPEEIWKILEDRELTDPNIIVFGYFQAADRDELQSIVDPLDLRIYGYAEADRINLGTRSLRDAPEAPAFLDVGRSYRGPGIYRLSFDWSGERPEFSDDLLRSIESVLGRPGSERIYSNFERSAG